MTCDERRGSTAMRRRLGDPIGVALLAGVLASCSGSSGAGATPTPSPRHQATDYSMNALFPAHPGDSWSYKVTAGVSAGTTQKLTVSGSHATADVNHVIMKSAVQSPGTLPITSDEFYDFHTNGEVNLTYGSLSGGRGGTATGSGASILIPSQSDINSGVSRPFTASLTLNDPRLGQAPVTISGTSHGTGETTVTEMHRTLHVSTVQVDFSLDLTVTVSGKPNSVHVAFSLKLWLVQGVGMVRSEMTSTPGSGTTVTELQSTNLA